MLRRTLLLALGAMAQLLVVAAAAQAGKLTMRDGRVLEGKVVPLASISDDPKKRTENAAPVPRLIVMIDDDLRRTFVSKRQVAQVAPESSSYERFQLKQPVPQGGTTVANVGMILSVDPFDEHGRRIFRMGRPGGDPIEIIQGIYEITPQWTRVVGLNTIWDCRIATSSIPRDQLSKILAHNIDPTNVEHRLKVARLYLQSERYTDARAELEQIAQEFPTFSGQIEPVVNELRQLSARRLLSEIELRRGAGQHQLALRMLEQFPTDGVSGEILQQVRQWKESYQTEQDQVQSFHASFERQLAQITDAELRDRIEDARNEMFSELDHDTLDRVAAYLRLADDPQLQPTEKVALALSGWLVGSNGASQDLTQALAMYTMRNLTVEYFNEPNRVKRDQLLSEVISQEGASPELVAQLLALLKPPYPLPEEQGGARGLYELTVPGIAPDPEYQYLIQLPPEYDPHRRYPAIVTLHGAGTTPAHQVDWWAGGWDEKSQMRLGQATRHGYVVIAPSWTAAGQTSYDYSAHAHAAVLATLRDACRRFAIDTDRVFLSGHSMGGDAAWDIGLAHPDLWAGVIPIAAVSDKYGAFYWENARSLPFYIVEGELDGTKPLQNARDLDRCLTGTGFNFTAVEYRGRGHEHFSDEILRLFDWMGRFKRNFFPREIECRTMRTWDNYFYWLEVNDFPAKVVVDPAAWPVPNGTRAMVITATASTTNSLRIKTGAGRVTVWLSPELVDFQQKILVTVNNQRIPRGGGTIQPDLTVMLDDVRTRGDRQHPFWAKVESQ
ncbi:MAG: peptidase [Pirellulales bacterium]|nr:peptidase [Pirellulales bacterium]